MRTQDVLKLIGEKTDELLKELHSASPNWVRGRIEEIRDIAREGRNPLATKPCESSESSRSQKSGAGLSDAGKPE